MDQDDPAVLRMLLDEARLERDALQRRALALRDERDAARARVAELEAVVDSLRYRMTCVDPPPTFDEIIRSLARVATRRTDR